MADLKGIVAIPPVVLRDLFVFKEIFNRGQATKTTDSTGFNATFFKLELKVGPAIN